MSRWNNVEDGMGFAGFVPDKEDRKKNPTPGPWFVTKVSNQTELGSDVLIRARRPLRGDVPTWIAEVSAKDEQMANANLIAAAPDLLAACEAAMRIQSLWAPSDHQVAGDDSELVALAKMKEMFVAAIQKAKGEINDGQDSRNLVRDQMAVRRDTENAKGS